DPAGPVSDANPGGPSGDLLRGPGWSTPPPAVKRSLAARLGLLPPPGEDTGRPPVRGRLPAYGPAARAASITRSHSARAAAGSIHSGTGRASSLPSLSAAPVGPYG